MALDAEEKAAIKRGTDRKDRFKEAGSILRGSRKGGALTPLAE